MRPETTAFALLCMLLCVPSARADYITGYYALRPLPELGSVIIEHGYFRGKAAHARARTRRRTLARKGVFLADGNKASKPRARFKLGKRWLAITLTINPPTEHGIGGANYTAWLKVTIDGKTKIDSMFGYHAALNELDFKRVTLFEDGIIALEATFQDSGGNQRQLFLDDYGWFNTPEQLNKKLDNDALVAAVTSQSRRRPGTTDER